MSIRSLSPNWPGKYYKVIQTRRGADFAEEQAIDPKAMPNTYSGCWRMIKRIIVLTRCSSTPSAETLVEPQGSIRTYFSI